MIVELLQQSTGIWVTLSFVLFVALAYKKGKQSVITSLDSKINKIKEDIETAANLRIEAQDLLAQYQRQQREADKEAKSFLDEAKKQAAVLDKQAKETAKSIQSHREDWLKERIERMEKDAILEIKREISSISSKAAEEILISEIDQKSHDQMVDSTIKNLGKSFA